MNKISSILDSIADRLEIRGLVKEAEEIDAISNTIDTAYTYDKSASLDPYAAVLVAHVRGDMDKVTQASEDISKLDKNSITAVKPVVDILDKFGLTLRSHSGAAAENLCNNLYKIKV